jgi:outer membrane protein OmpA-like peptidoglycan-associated protein
VLHNIYYDLDKYNIRPDAAKELDKLVALLIKYPQVKIELGSHTDCRATYDYNMRLSQNRAKSAVEYLVQHGVNRSIVTAQGYGESKPINHCECEGERKVECTEEEHQLNRRTEIKVLSWHWSIASIQ